MSSGHQALAKAYKHTRLTFTLDGRPADDQLT
jgi:hypothetical protein